ncbi:hypothetical protein MMC07_002614 [Pseudocyphellaria aurata]|nr:hypothetical protein [Pseudocyphellaria aurata]
MNETGCQNQEIKFEQLSCTICYISTLHAQESAPHLLNVHAEVRGVAQVACSSCQTLAVLQHDAEAENTEERRKGYKFKMKSFSRLAQQAATALPSMAALLRESRGMGNMRIGSSKHKPGVAFSMCYA